MIKKVLFLTESREDYLADSLLHGLISLGIEIVDYPRKDLLYHSSTSCISSPRLGVRGNGFTLYGLLPDRTVDRSFIIQRLQVHYFDIVIIGQIWRQWGQLLDLAPYLQDVPVVLLDGDDDTRLFHLSGTRMRRYGWQPFPIRSGRCLYLKREWQGNHAISRYCTILPASFTIPVQKVLQPVPNRKSQLFATHCVDPEVASVFGLHTSYAFSSETDYFDDMSLSRFAVTTKRGGWDCLRHYEIAAAGSLMCFKDLESKPTTCAPHGLVPGLNCLSYQNTSDLFEQIQQLESNHLQYQQMLKRSHDWVRTHTTIAAAQRLLSSIPVQ